MRKLLPSHAGVALPDLHYAVYTNLDETGDNKSLTIKTKQF